MPKRRRPKRLSTVGLAALAIATVGGGSFVLLDSSAGQTAKVAPRVQQYYDEQVTKANVAPTPTSSVASIRYAVYGDSITEGNSADFVGGELGSLSWTSYLGSGFTFAGGWAKGGVETDEMLANARPVIADVLVLLAGANDYAHDVPFAQTAANLDGIVATTGVSRVVVSAVPPSDLAPDDAAAFNVNLQKLAAARGWQFIDPMAELRAGTNYARGMTSDGVHPTEAAAQLIGKGIAAAITA